MIVIKDNITILKNELSLSFARSSGPGGQNVNKVNSKAVLHWNIEENYSLRVSVKIRFKKRFANRINNEGYVVISSESSRDRETNIKNCYDKLKDMVLSVWSPPKRRIPTAPSKSSKERRVDSKKVRSKIKKLRKKINY